jgi:hypothetical protein
VWRPSRSGEFVQRFDVPGDAADRLARSSITTAVASVPAPEAHATCRPPLAVAPGVGAAAASGCVVVRF